MLRSSRQQITREWWETRRPFHQLFTSQRVLDEAAIGDSVKAAERLAILSRAMLLDLTAAALDFTEDITQSRILPVDAGVGV